MYQGNMNQQRRWMALEPRFAWIWWGLIVFVAYMSLRPLNLDLGVRNGDKVLHLATYAFLALSAPWRFQRRIPLVVLSFLMLLGGLLEVGQGVLPTGRSAEFADAGANAAGACIGVLVRVVMMWKSEKGRSDGNENF
jgi:VanZ family protein